MIFKVVKGRLGVWPKGSYFTKFKTGAFCAISIFSRMGAPVTSQGHVASWALPLGILDGEEAP